LKQSEFNGFQVVKRRAVIGKPPQFSHLHHAFVTAARNLTGRNQVFQNPKAQRVFEQINVRVESGRHFFICEPRKLLAHVAPLFGG
jgi:hypothetical protein